MYFMHSIRALHTSIKKKLYHRSVNLKHVTYDLLQHHNSLFPDGIMMLRHLWIQTNIPELALSAKEQK
jgi:hypothetical protein